MTSLKTTLTTDKCPEDQSCIHFKQYRNNENSLLHFETYRHTMIQCRYNGDCRAFQRLIKGGYRLEDRGHCLIYSHPSRRDNAHVEKSIGVKKLITGELEVTTHEKKLSIYDDVIAGDKNIEKNMIRELNNNGFGRVMKIPFQKNKTLLRMKIPFQKVKTLWDIADEKMNHKRHVSMGRPLSRVEILSILLYTGTDAYLDLRKTETLNYLQPDEILQMKSWPTSLNPLKERDQKWEYFSKILSNAIKKLSKHDIKKRAAVTYHGLLDVELDQENFFSYWEYLDQNRFACQRRIFDTFKYPSFVSTSTDRKEALKSMTKCNITRGCLMELEIGESCDAADVSWISKFPRECEILIDKGSEFYVRSLEFDEINNIQIAKLNV